MTMTYPKQVLSKIKWTGNPYFDGVSITYISRGEPNDEVTVSEKEILDLFGSYFQIKRESNKFPVVIPFHRIKYIKLNGEVIWDYENPKGDEDYEGNR